MGKEKPKSYYKIQKCKGCDKPTKFYYFLGKRKSPFCNACLIKKKRYVKTLPCSKCKTPTRFTFVNGFRKSRLCRNCLNKQEQIKKTKHRNTKTYQAKTFRRLIKELDTVFSLYIRARDGDCVLKNEKCNDILQNGHLIKRGNQSTRFNELNCNCQCSYHNYLHNTEPEHYTNWFINKYGQAEYDKLYRESRQIKKWTITELEGKIKHYKEELKTLKID